MSAEMLGLWIGFNVMVLMLLALDLGVFSRQAHEVSLREAAIWSVGDCTILCVNGRIR